MSFGRKQRPAHEGVSSSAKRKLATGAQNSARHSLPGLQSAIGNRALRRMMGSADSIPKTASQGASGSSGSLPYLSQIQRSFGRHDVSHIRACQDSRAGAAARALGARAYTLGDRVAFAGVPDLRTAAHEAAHVVQQRAGVQLTRDVGKVGDVYERHADAVADLVTSGRSAESLLDRMAPVGSRAVGGHRHLVQRALDTNYGVFATTKYEDVGAKGSEYGVDIELNFDPDKTKVDAKKIGLTQRVRSQLAGAAAAMYPVHQSRAVPSGTGEGSRIDRISTGGSGNPIYGTKVNKATDKLGDTEMGSNAGWGWHYMDGKTEKHEKAWLKDKPTLPGHGKNAAQKFETVALAVEGTQNGTYMGSVTWGWSVDGSGNFTKDKVTVNSKGTPSAEFKAAAEQWNKTAVGGTVKVIADKTNVYNDSYSPAFSVDKDTEVTITKGYWIHDDQTYDQVTIKSGKHVGKSGKMKVSDMKESGGTAVMKLPIP